MNRLARSINTIVQPSQGAVASGGVVFTTIQKFLSDRGEKMPRLSERRNIIVIADETHKACFSDT